MRADVLCAVAASLRDREPESQRFALRVERGRVVSVCPVFIPRRWHEWVEALPVLGVPDGLRVVACMVNQRGAATAALVEPVAVENNKEHCGFPLASTGTVG